MRTTIDMLSVWKPLRRGFLAAVVLTALIAQAPAGVAGTLVPWFGIIEGRVDLSSGHVEATEMSNHGGKGTQDSWITSLSPVALGITVHTTADGDQIFNTFELTLSTDGTCEGSYKVTGGTGRFADASGTGRLWGYLTADSRIVLYFDGTISSPGSNTRKGVGPK